jgi:hypothetical protein
MDLWLSNVLRCFSPAFAFGYGAQGRRLMIASVAVGSTLRR